MGFWTKKEETHYTRDKYGNVINIERRTAPQINASNVDDIIREKLIRKQEKREAKMRERNERQMDRDILRAEEKEAYQKAYREARLTRKTREGRQAASTGPYPRLQNIILGPTRPRPIKIKPTRVVQYARPTKRKRSKKNARRKPRPNLGGFGFDPIDNWGLWR